MAGVGQTILNSAWAKMEENGFNHLTVAGVLQTPLYWWKEFDTYKFQSPYGGIGASDAPAYTVNKESFVWDVSITLRWQG